MSVRQPHQVVHLELHTQQLSAACAFYEDLLHWRSERLDVGSGTYHALDLAGGLDGGVVECDVPHASWLPYVEVTEIYALTERARQMGALVLLEPREGPAGWRSVVSTLQGGEVALWQPKQRFVRAI